MAIVNGTEGNDVIGPNQSTTGDDTINAFGGNDVIRTSGGFDTIDAGDGDDILQSVGDTPQGFNATMGAGNDYLDFIFSDFNSTFDLGSGDDWAVALNAAAGVTLTVTTGAGRDIISRWTGDGITVFTDFDCGPNGDSFQFLVWYVSHGFWLDVGTLGSNGIPNPFGAGVAQLIDTPQGATLQVRSNVNNSWTTIAVFQNRTVSQFHSDAFLGYAIDGSPTVGKTLNVVEVSQQFRSVDTAGNDIIYGTSAGGYIHYTGGNDIIYAGEGNDIVQGGATSVASGYKVIYGGGGNDQLGINGQESSGRDANGFPTGNSAWGLIHGDDGDDSIGGNWGNDELYGDAGADFVNGGGGDDYVDGGSDNDTVYGGPGRDIVRGGSGDDVVRGGSEDDKVYGDAGADNVQGESGNDTVSGGLGIDTLSGGTGVDLFRDTAAGLNGDTITDFEASERIVISDATLQGFTFSLSGNVLTFTGGSITLNGAIPTGLVATAAAGGGVQIAVARDPQHDFNGDGRSDVMWRHSGGTMVVWLGNANGSFTNNGNAAANPVDASWQVAGFGDFNGDGRDDIIWRHTATGTVAEWQGQASGSFINTSDVMPNAVDTSWNIVGVGDFNGDGRDDVFWRHTATGSITEWVGQPNGGFNNNSGAAANVVDTSWQVKAVADFNGDGMADVLWQHSSGIFGVWQGTASGALANIGGVMGGATGNVVGSGDFNGDGRADVLMRQTSGTIVEWLGQANGQFTQFTPSVQLTDSSWKIAEIGDFNGDGQDDLLWRHSSGANAIWLASSGGNFTNGGSLPSIDLSWSVQSPDGFLF